MPAITGPVILSAQEFAAQPLGVDTSKLLKALTTLPTGALAAATSLSIADKQGSAPARFDPRTSAIPSYAINNGDIVFIGAGTTADPMEWTVATAAPTGGGPYALAISPALVYAHPANSPVSVGTLQQELLSAALSVERHIGQPIAITLHPDPRWPPNELLLGQVWASVDARGIPTLYVPFTPIDLTYTPTIQYKLGAGTAVAWTSADVTQWEVLTDRIVGPQGMFRRGQFVIFKVGYQSGWSPIPDDMKEAHRIVGAEFLKRRGGQAVISGSGRRIQSTTEKDIDIPETAKALLQPFVRVR